MVLTFTFFFHQGLNPVCRSEEIISNITTWKFCSLPDCVPDCFSFGKYSCKSCWSWASASLFPSGSSLCWSLGHFLAALTGHFMGRAAAGQQDAVQSLTSSMSTSALGGKPGEVHLKYPPVFRNSVRNAVLRDFFLQKGIQSVLLLPRDFFLETITELIILMKFKRHLKV